MDVHRARQASDNVYELAEGIIWDEADFRLRWVDIPMGRVYSATLDDGLSSAREDAALACPVSAVVRSSRGGLLLAAGSALALLDARGSMHVGAPFIHGAGRRLNDGSCDALGRFFVGTVTDGRIVDDESLYRAVDAEAPALLRRDLHHANGVGWSPDGDQMYLVDSVPGDVWGADYQLSSGRPTGWRVLFRVQDGLPDGLAVDAEGALWIAIWGAGEVRRYSPSGRLLSMVHVPTPFVTSLALAGADRRSMYITTARGDSSQADSAAGALFTVRVDVPGLPTNLWSGGEV